VLPKNGVTDGAVCVKLDAVALAAVTWMGLALLTPVNASMPPAAALDALNVHV
jgi:hypothetical protein